MFARRHRLSVVVSAIVLSLLSVGIWAAGNGAPDRGIPFHGTLYDGPTPMTTTVPMTFRLFDGDENDGSAALLWEDTFDVDVVSGRFSVVMGDVNVALPDSVTSAAQLFVAVEVDGTPLGTRQQVWAAAQAIRAARAGTLTVTGNADIGQDLDVTRHTTIGGDLTVESGNIHNDAPHSNAGTDLGLYSSTDGKYIRIVNNNARTVFYSDDDYGTSPDLTIRNDRTFVHDPLDAQSGLNVTGTTTTDGLSVENGMFGSYSSVGFNTTHTASSNGFLMVILYSNNNGARGYADLLVDGSTRANASVHYYTTNDNHIARNSAMVPVAAGSTYRANLTHTSSTIAATAYFVSIAP